MIKIYENQHHNQPSLTPRPLLEMGKSVIANPTTSDHKVLSENTSAIVNKKRASSDAIEPENTKKQKKATLKTGFDLSTPTPPSFLEDIILPDEDEVQFACLFSNWKAWHENVWRL